MKIKFLTLSLLLFISTIHFSFKSNLENLRLNLGDKADSSDVLRTELLPVINQTFEELKVPGAIIGVWMGNHEPLKTTIGVADLKTKQPILLSDKMRIGSITKTFTGTVLLQLVDEGKISLSDKLNKYFPDFPNGDNITIQEVGDMRSGIYNYSEDSTFGAVLMKNLSTPFTPVEVLDIALKHKPYFSPDQGFHYSNTNFTLLGLIIEKLTGNPLQTEIKNRILNPLGMSNSDLAIDAAFPDPHSHGYMYMDSLATQPTDVTNQDPIWGWAAGSMISTLDDLSKYAKPLATGTLISVKSQSDRLKWKTDMMLPTGAWKDRNLKYGFGIASFEGAIGHNGGIPGYNSFMGYIPEKDATIIVLVNMQDNKEGIGPADYIARKIVEKVKNM